VIVISELPEPWRPPDRKVSRATSPYPSDREVVCYRLLPLADAAAELAGTSRPKWGDVEAPILPLSYRSTAAILPLYSPYLPLYREPYRSGLCREHMNSLEPALFTLFACLYVCHATVI